MTTTNIKAIYHALSYLRWKREILQKRQDELRAELQDRMLWVIHPVGVEGAKSLELSNQLEDIRDQLEANEMHHRQIREELQRLRDIKYNIHF